MSETQDSISRYEREFCSVVLGEKITTYTEQTFLLWSPPSAVHSFEALAKDLPILYLSWLNSPVRLDYMVYALTTKNDAYDVTFERHKVSFKSRVKL